MQPSRQELNHNRTNRNPTSKTHNHRINASEPAVKNTKYHTLASFATLDPNYPIQLWRKFTNQIEITPNILRTSRRDSSKSAYHNFHNNKIDWNKTPLAPLGTTSLTFKDLDNIRAWQPHGVDAWYIGPTTEHYRLMRFHDPRTGGKVSTGTFRLYPAHCRTPTISEGDQIILAAADLVDILKIKQPELVSKRHEHVRILKQLPLVFASNASSKGEGETLHVRRPHTPNNATHNNTRPSTTHTS